MEREVYYQKLKEIIAPYLPEDVAVAAIGPDSNLVDELNINSANIVDIILDVEDEFDVMLENEDMDAMHTVADVVAIIKRKQETK